MMPYCASEGIAVIPWSPMARGYLAGSGVGPNAATVRGRTDPFSVTLGLGSDQDEAIRARVVEAARDLGTKPAIVALAWVLSKSYVTAPLRRRRRRRRRRHAAAALFRRARATSISSARCPSRRMAGVQFKLREQGVTPTAFDAAAAGYKVKR